MTHESTIEISIYRYNQLIDNEKFLNALRAAGVDNWVGYDFALEILEGEQ